MDNGATKEPEINNGGIEKGKRICHASERQKREEMQLMFNAHSFCLNGLTLNLAADRLGLLGRYAVGNYALQKELKVQGRVKVVENFSDLKYVSDTIFFLVLLSSFSFFVLSLVL